MSGLLDAPGRAFSVEEAQANADKLDRCPAIAHAFKFAVEGSRRGEEPRRVAIYECIHCEGRLRSAQKHWYEVGLNHGRRLVGGGRASR